MVQFVGPSTDEAENDVHKNLILNVNVTNLKKSKCFLNPSNCFIIVTFGVLLSLLLMFLQLQELETKIHSHTLKHQGNDNQNNPIETLNRLVDYNNFVRPNISSIHKLSNQMEVRGDRHTDSVMSMSYNPIYSNQSSYFENNAIKRSSLSDDARSISKLVNLFNEFRKRENFTNLLNDFNKRERFRDFPVQSYTKVEISSDHRSIIWSEPHMGTLQRVKRDSEERQSEKENDKQQNEEESNKQKEENKEIQRPRKGKRETVAKGNTRRQNERKGEKQRQGKRRHNHKQSRPLVATFIGAQPELINAVYIGPWIRKEFTNHKYDFNDFHLVEDNMAIEVQINGLYMLSVQVETREIH